MTPFHPAAPAGQTRPTHSLHPVLIAAAIAVMLFCAVGTAALLGWLPSSTGGNPHPNGALTASDQLASPPIAQTPPSQAMSASVAGLAPAAVAAAAPQEQARPAPVAQAAPCLNCGVVESVREVTTRAQGSGVGAAGGAVVGGLLGNQVGSGHGRELATIVGAIGGAVAGNQVEGNIKATRSYNITVRLDNGHTRSFHQSTPPRWRSGDHVRIVKGALRAR